MSLTGNDLCFLTTVKSTSPKKPGSYYRNENHSAKWVMPKFEKLCENNNTCRRVMVKMQQQFEKQRRISGWQLNYTGLYLHAHSRHCCSPSAFQIEWNPTGMPSHACTPYKPQRLTNFVTRSTPAPHFSLSSPDWTSFSALRSTKEWWRVEFTPGTLSHDYNTLPPLKLQTTLAALWSVPPNQPVSSCMEHLSTDNRCKTQEEQLN